MIEILTDLTHPSTLYGMYVGLLLGLTVHLVWGFVSERLFYAPIAHFDYSVLDPFANHNDPINIFRLSNWIADIIRRKECPKGEDEDHILLEKK